MKAMLLRRPPEWGSRWLLAVLAALAVALLTLSSCRTEDARGALRGENADLSRLTALPNPIQDCDHDGLGTTTVSWDFAPRGRGLEVHVDSPSGPLFASAVGAGAQETGNWARPGMRFVLYDPLEEAVVAELVVDLSYVGCP